MANNTIPTTDAALLAAQAQAGQAGVDAYNAARSQLEQQRRSAIEQAMAEATARGAPAGSVESIQSQITSPYDARLASLSQGQAGFSDAMASRDRRMADYNAAVLSARGLIGDQTRQAVAPITAETDMRVRLAQQQGQNEVDKINAQLRLETARMAAQAAAAGRGGGGGGRGGGGGGGGGKKSDLGSITQTKLRATLASNAQTKLGAVAAKSAQAMRQTAEQQRQAASYTGRSAQEAARQRVGPISGGDRAALEQQRLAASYAGQSRDAELRAAQQPPPNLPITPRFTPHGSVTFGGPMVPPSQSQFGNAANLTGAQAALDAIMRQRPGVIQNYQRQNETASRRNREIIRQATEMALGAAPLYADPTTSMFTAAQLGEFAGTPDASLYSMLFEQGPVRRFSDIDERLLGTPEAQRDEYGNTMGAYGMGMLPRRAPGAAGGSTGPMTLPSLPGNEQNPQAREALKQAMWLSAADLQDMGYDIDTPDVEEAIGADETYKPGSTLFDMQQRSAGLPDYRTQLEERQEAEDKLSADATATERANVRWEDYLSNQDEQDTAEAARIVFAEATGGRSIPAGFSPQSALSIVQGGAYQQAMNALSQLAEGDRPRNKKELHDVLLDQVNLNPLDQSHAPVIAMIEALYG